MSPPVLKNGVDLVKACEVSTGGPVLLKTSEAYGECTTKGIPDLGPCTSSY